MDRPSEADTASEEKWEEVHFTISGESLTDIARNLVEEGKWEQAAELLHKGLSGISYDDVFAVLAGTKNLVGDSNVGVSFEDATPDEKYLGQLAWLYGARHWHGGSWWEAYGYISYPTSLFPVDWFSENTELSPVASIRDMRGYVRGWADMFSIAQMPNRHYRAVLWQKCAAPPLWMHDTLKRRSLEAATAAALASGRVPEVGDASVCDRKRFAGIAFDGDSGETERVLAEVKAMEPQPPPGEKPLVADRKCLSWSGWILPSGAFYPCNAQEHMYLAGRIWREVFGKPTEWGLSPFDADRSGEEAGWVRVSSSKDVIDFLRYKVRKLPRAQAKTLERWCAAHEVAYPEPIC